MEPGSPTIRLSVAILILLASFAVLPITYWPFYRTDTPRKRLNQGQRSLPLFKCLLDAALFVLVVLEVLGDYLTGEQSGLGKSLR